MPSRLSAVVLCTGAFTLSVSIAVCAGFLEKVSVFCGQTVNDTQTEDAYAKASRLLERNDTTTARIRLEALAKTGDRRAQCTLGVMYHEGGAGLWRDETKAVRWFRSAADQEFAPAQHSLAVLYYNGLSTADYEPDYKATISWLDRAVKQKYLPSMTLLGRMYVFGEGVEEDVGRGVELWRFAAEHGFHTAQVLMGMVYHRGDLGVPRDLDMAYKWYQKAADQGDDFGRDQVRRMDIWCQKDANARISCP